MFLQDGNVKNVHSFAFIHHGDPLIKLHSVDCYDSLVLIMLSLNIEYHFLCTF